ncbi:hypothetical protein NM688_g5719 [Phlebia brevispora]|uniref:Uncharacterized protein n=1 Tax=Phlebia brevispora TaxID=194682 RepID=A0ACC1SQP9_9APHY|nr:hypothetical protein NM688_g5719 [Phlebia brevispora]
MSIWQRSREAAAATAGHTTGRSWVFFCHWESLGVATRVYKKTSPSILFAPSRHHLHPSSAPDSTILQYQIIQVTTMSVLSPPNAGGYQRETMVHLVHHTAPNAWTDIMARASQHFSQTELRNLLFMLEKVGMDVEGARRVALNDHPVQLRCVRCHEEYTEGQNAFGACCTRHLGVYRGLCLGHNTYEYMCRYCGKAGVGVQYGAHAAVQWEYPVCYEGLHTVDEAA